MILTLKVTLNGTDTNPFHAMGLTQRPFPQLGKAEYDAQERILNRLAAEPIPDVGYRRKTLTDAGFSPEFVDLCCSQ